LRILVVYNVVDLLDKGEAHDLLAEQDIVLVEQAIESALRSYGHETVAVPIRDDLWEPLAQFDPNEWLIFNLCESIRDKSYLEPYVISVFEYLGFRYTGSPHWAIRTCLNKARAKEILQAHSIPTAPFQVIEPGPVRRRLDFPLFVKPVAEDASLGITPNSVVESDRELRQQVRYIWERYRQPALVEAFIRGREFNVTVLGNDAPRVLPLSEINFARRLDPRERIVTYQAKWVPESRDYQLTPTRCPARVTENLRMRIADAALRAYKVMGLHDYGRVDIRVMAGVPYVLEVNPNADLSPGAGIARAAQAAGMTYADLADEIVRLAARRNRLKTARPRLVSLRVKALTIGAEGLQPIPLTPPKEKLKRLELIAA
jgi:D-alanine-D-alanine ligase